MHELRRLEHMSKEQREAYILALKPPATATEEERQRFELLRQIALGQPVPEALRHYRRDSRRVLDADEGQHKKT